jgi:CDP-diacylglycerol--glycerol-3-phosphate 3-phosphatidyltransferase
VRSSPLVALRRWWATAACVSLLAATVVAGRLPLVPADRRLYLLAAAAALVVAFFGVWLLLGENRQPGELAPSPRLGPANAVTVGRAAATALLAGFVVVPWPGGRAAWLPALLYLAVVAGDALDGWLARRSGFVTAFGVRLDLEVDAAALLVATVLAVRRGTLPEWVLAAGAARYVYVALRAVVRRVARVAEEPSLPPSTRRRLRAGQQMALVAVALWPAVPVGASHLAAIVVTVPFLAGFLRDGLVATSALRPLARGYLRLRTAVQVALELAVPLAARLALAVGLVGALATGFAPAERVAATLAGWGWPAAGGIAACAVLATLVAALAAIVGIVPRSASLVLLAAFFVELQSAAVDEPRVLLLLASLWIVVFGSGPFTLWARDEAVLGPERDPRDERAPAWPS